MTKFEFGLPTKIYFGTGITENALRSEQRWLKEKVMIVTTGGSLIKYGYLDRLKANIEQIAGRGNVKVFDEISKNPKLDEVKRAAEFAGKHGIGVIVGFGGGSALDAAKAVAAGADPFNDLEACLLEGKAPSDQTLPIIALPTTAGTGSELSRAAIISSPQHHVKAGIRGENIIPKVAVVDAAYTWSVSKKVTMQTGFDTIAHAIESYVSRKANLFSEMLSERAALYAGDSLRMLNEDIDNHEAREKMCYASMIMGINLLNVGTCLPHRMQYPIGAVTDTGHAEGLAALYPSWIWHEYSANMEKLDRILSLLGLDGVGTADRAEKRFRQFLSGLGIDNTLLELGISEDMLDDMAVHVSGSIDNDVIAEESGIIRKIYDESLGKEMI